MSRRSTEGIKLASKMNGYIFFDKLNTDAIGKFRGQIGNGHFPIFATVPYRKGICFGNVFL